MRLTFIACICILFIGLASAELQVTPSTLDIQQKVNEQKVYNVTLHNNFPFEIKDVVFSNLTGFTFPSITLAPNETRTVNFTVQLPSSVSDSIQSVISFSYMVDIPSDIETHDVNITSSGFVPNYLVIHSDDSINFHNLDDVSHTVTSSTFDYSLASNQVQTVTFPTPGQIDYQDLIMFNGGTINVLNRTAPQEIHNPINDRVWTVNLDVTSEPTQLTVSAPIISFTVDPTGYKEGSLLINNSGTTRAERIRLTSTMNWVIFEEDNFDIDSNDVNFVNFKVSPMLTSTNETNQTYYINLTIHGSNTPEYTLPLTVFVPYSNLDNELGSDQQFLVWFSTVFCPRNPTLVVCNNTLSAGGSSGKTVIKDPQLTINGSLTQVSELLKRLQRIEDAAQRTDNKNNELNDKLNQLLPGILDSLNKTETAQEAQKNNSNENWVAAWIVAIFTFITAFILVVGWQYNKYRARKNLLVGVTQ